MYIYVYVYICIYVHKQGYVHVATNHVHIVIIANYGQETKVCQAKESKRTSRGDIGTIVWNSGYYYYYYY
jgi:hypothetical protein